MTQLILFIDRLTEENWKSVIMFEDSLFSRNRSKKVELLAKVFDNTSHEFCKGFRMLTMGWSHGNIFMPVSFSLLISLNDKNVLREAKTTNKRLLAYKRRRLAKQGALDVVLTMFRNAKDIPAKLMLFDSWFTMPKTVIRVKMKNRDIIGMIRITERSIINTKVNGKMPKVSTTRLNGPPILRIPGSVCVKLKEDKASITDKFIDTKIVFVKDRSLSNWLAILCTDISVSDEEIVHIYESKKCYR